jgi:hypothetical protein
LFNDYLLFIANLRAYLSLVLQSKEFAMQVLFESRDVDGSRVRPLAVRRLRFALRRLSWLVPRARVQLCDINGPRGGVDKQCRIELDSAGAPPTLITALARDWRSAIDQAVARAARTLLRTWRRSRGNHHRSIAAARLGFAQEPRR